VLDSAGLDCHLVSDQERSDKEIAVLACRDAPAETGHMDLADPDMSVAPVAQDIVAVPDMPVAPDMQAAQDIVAALAGLDIAVEDIAAAPDTEAVLDMPAVRAESGAAWPIRNTAMPPRTYEKLTVHLP